MHFKRKCRTIHHELLTEDCLKPKKTARIPIQRFRAKYAPVKKKKITIFFLAPVRSLILPYSNYSYQRHCCPSGSQ